MAYVAGAFIGGVVGTVLCYLPVGSHVENELHAGNVTVQSNTLRVVVNTNILGDAVGTDPFGWILLGAVLGVTALLLTRRAREGFAS